MSAAMIDKIQIGQSPIWILSILAIGTHNFSCMTLYFHEGNFPWMVPVLHFGFLCSSRSESFQYLNKIALELVKGQCESVIKVIILTAPYNNLHDSLFNSIGTCCS